MTLNPADFKHILVAFSGGKDSVASFLTVRDAGVDMDRVSLIFTDTGHEMPETYDYLRWFDKTVFPVQRLVQHVSIQNPETGRRRLRNTLVDWDTPISDFPGLGYLTIFDEIRNRYQSNPDVPVWPGHGIRYCTRALKINPFYKFIRHRVEKEKRGSDILIVKGLRREESSQREDTPEFGIESSGGDLYNVWFPVYDLTLEQVFNLHWKHDIQINPVYGIRTRSNCVGCPFASDSDIVKTRNIYPDIFDEYAAIEDETGYTWRHNTSIKDINSLNDNESSDDPSCNSGFCDI